MGRKAASDGSGGRRLRLVILAFALLWSAGAQASAPLSAYGALPFIEEMKISPDGHRLAFVTTDGEARTLVVKNLDTGAFDGRINAGRHKIRDLDWAGADHIIVSASTAGHRVTLPEHSEYFTAVDYDRKRQREKSLLAPGPKGFSFVAEHVQARTIEGKTVVFVQGYSPERPEDGYALYRVGLDAGGPPFVMQQGAPHVRRVLVDPNGRLLAQSEYDSTEERWDLKLWHGAWVDAAHTAAPVDTPALLGLGRSERSVLVYLDDGPFGVLRDYDADGSVTTLPLDLHGDFDIVRDASDRLLGVHELAGEDDRYVFLSPDDRRRWEVIQKAFPGQLLPITSVSDDHKRFLVTADSGKESPAFYMVDMITGAATWIADQYPNLTPSDIFAVRPIAFQARDGLAVTGYLTLPARGTDRPLPLVVLPHGGPRLRDTPGFDWWSQALASRGYAVLRVNFRGSSGLGRGFEAAGHGEWGRKMQSDLADGVSFLARSHAIDPARVCIVGASYGGYAALAGATFAAGPYRCAVAIAAPSDPRKMVGYTVGRSGDEQSRTRRLWARYLGPADGLSAISPLDQTSRASIPILLIHGKDDIVVPFDRSEAMFKALRAAGKDVEFIPLEGEDHWLSEGDTRLKALTATVEFLEKNNPPT